MAKYLLLKHYRGGPAPVVDTDPMDRWAPTKIDAHVQYMRDFGAKLEGTGEYVDGQALSRRGRLSVTAARPAAGHRRPVRRDQGPDRRVDGDRRGDVRASRRAGGRALGRAWPGRQADLRMARAASVPDRRTHRCGVNETLLRELIPAVTGVLVRRGADFATAEDAVQEALIRALATWPKNPPADPKGWLITVAWRKFLDATRTENSRHAREARAEAEPPPGLTRTPTTPCSSTFCAPTRRSPRHPPWRSHCGRWAG